MQHRDGYGNENHRHESHRAEISISQEERDWVYRENEQYHAKFASERDDHEVEQEDAEKLDGEGETDHQEGFGADDKAESSYTDVHFRYRKRARGKIEGKLWAPPSSKGLHTPVFVRLKDLQSQGPARGAAETPAVEMDASEGH